MENYKLVLRGDLNQNGYLFGGNLLKWVDEFSWIAASLDFPGCSFVTLAMDNVVFRKSIKEGSVLKFDIRLMQKGTTSARYSVDVLCRKSCDDKMIPVFSTIITFVNVDNYGGKTAIPTLH